jgi:hypothetical protein
VHRPGSVLPSGPAARPVNLDDYDALWPVIASPAAAPPDADAALGPAFAATPYRVDDF